MRENSNFPFEAGLWTFNAKGSRRERPVANLSETLENHISSNVNPAILIHKYIKYGSKKIGLTFGRINQKLLTLQQNGSS